MIKASKQTMDAVLLKLDPLLVRLNRNPYDFLSNASPLRLRRTSLLTGVSVEDLTSCQNTIVGWRGAALREQDDHYDQRHLKAPS